MGVELSGPINWKGKKKLGDLEPQPQAWARRRRGWGPTWSLAAFLGQGRERKYRERVASGLAIWVEMLAARVGVRKEGWGWGWGLESGSQPPPALGLEP